MSSKYHGETGWATPVNTTAFATVKAKRKGGTKGTSPLLTDAQILEVRALSQFAGWDCARLMARYGVDKGMIDRVISGVTRSRLVAALRHLPEGVTPI